MLVAVLPEDSGFRSGTAVLAVSATAVFAIVASGYAAPAVQVKERLFWVLMSSGLLLRFAGYLSWLGLGESPSAMQDAPVTQALYILSYLLLFAAMLYLIGIATRRIAWISGLDAVAVILSFGTLVWFFALGDAVQPSGVADSIAAAARPALDAGLLYASLVIVSAPRRPRWANFLAPGFLTLLIACLFYLGGPGGTRSVGGWTELLGALGLALLGAGALYAASHKSGFETHQTIPPWRIFTFWLGPLSPAMHLGILMVWGIYNPPLPGYVLAVSAGLMAYFALRISLLSYIHKQSDLEQVVATRRTEQDRILQELHETVKQGVHGISLTLDSASEAARLGEATVVRDRISRARDTIRETEYQISSPYDELRSRHEEEAHAAGSFLCYRLSRFEEYFSIKAHRDLQSPLDDLEEDEMEAVNRIAVEAFWNVARHSRARNLYLESRQVGQVLIVRIRDDGRGFDSSVPSSGMGLLLMNRRAREVGADLDVISKPGVGTTVQLRFRGKSL
jgi:signal transduction histidine kinase